MYQIVTRTPSQFLNSFSHRLLIVWSSLICLFALFVITPKAHADRQRSDQELINAVNTGQVRFEEFAKSLEKLTDQDKIRILVQTLNQIDRSLFIYANPSFGTDTRGQQFNELLPLDQARLDALQFDNAPLTQSDLETIHHFLNESKNRLDLLFDIHSLASDMLLKNYNNMKETNKWVSIASWASSGMAIAFGFMPEVPAIASLVPLSGMLYFTVLEHRLKRTLKDMQTRLSALSSKEAKEETKKFLGIITQITVAMKVFEHVKEKVAVSPNACTLPFRDKE